MSQIARVVVPRKIGISKIKYGVPRITLKGVETKIKRDKYFQKEIEVLKDRPPDLGKTIIAG